MNKTNPFGIQDDGKTAGLLSYFFVLGWSMAFFTFHKNEKTSLSSYHLRQTLLLYISYIMIRYGLFAALGAMGAVNEAPLTLVVFINVTFVAFWVTGLIGASKAEEKPIPVLGTIAQTIFSKL